MSEVPGFCASAGAERTSKGPGTVEVVSQTVLFADLLSLFIALLGASLRRRTMLRGMAHILRAIYLHHTPAIPPRESVYVAGMSIAIRSGAN